MGYGPEAPVPIFQHEAEFEVLLALYRAVKPERVLEVGTYHGGTLYHWLRNAGKGARVVSLDSYAVGVDNRALYDGWCPKGVSVVAIEADSRSPAALEQAERHAPYDWLFIDAGHYYDEVRSDWETFSPLVSYGGVVAFHDILPPTAEHPEIEVARLWEELKERGHRTFEIVESRGAAWGGIGVVLL